MDPTSQMYRHVPVLGRLVLSLLVPVVALTFVTAASEPAGANAPRVMKPGVPTSVIAVPLGGGAAVSWAGPTSDGGSPITGYSVRASHGGQTCTTTGATTCTVAGLTNGRLYMIKVRAFNAKGDGHASAPAEVTPSVPTVSFSEPDDFPFSGGGAEVDLSQPSTVTVQADFATSDGPEVFLYEREWIGDAADFSPNSGTVTFAPGQTVSSAPISVIGTTATGCNITIPTCLPSLTVTISRPTNATLGPTPVTNLYYE